MFFCVNKKMARILLTRLNMNLHACFPYLSLALSLSLIEKVTTLTGLLHLQDREKKHFRLNRIQTSIYQALHKTLH